MKKLLIGLLIIPAIAHAEFETGNTLMAKMTGESPQRMFALGYVAGVFDANQRVTHCAPDGPGITNGQINDIVFSYLSNNPSIRHRTADVLIQDALKQIWPCANRNPGRGA